MCAEKITKKEEKQSVSRKLQQPIHTIAPNPLSTLAWCHWNAETASFFTSPLQLTRKQAALHRYQLSWSDWTSKTHLGIADINKRSCSFLLQPKIRQQRQQSLAYLFLQCWLFSVSSIPGNGYSTVRTHAVFLIRKTKSQNTLKNYFWRHAHKGSVTVSFKNRI